LKIKNIAEDLEIHRDTVRKIKKRYLEGGLKRALYDNPRSLMPKKYSDKQEAEYSCISLH
jgi:transposase